MPNKIKTQKRRSISMSKFKYNSHRKKNNKSVTKVSVSRKTAFKKKSSIHMVYTHYIVINREIHMCRLLLRPIEFEQNGKKETFNVPYLAFVEAKEVDMSKNKSVAKYLVAQYDKYSIVDYPNIYESFIEGNSNSNIYLHPVDKNNRIYLYVIAHDPVCILKEKSILCYRCTTPNDYLHQEYVDTDMNEKVDHILDKICDNANNIYHIIQNKLKLNDSIRDNSDPIESD